MQRKVRVKHAFTTPYDVQDSAETEIKSKEHTLVPNWAGIGSLKRGYSPLSQNSSFSSLDLPSSAAKLNSRPTTQAGRAQENDKNDKNASFPAQATRLTPESKPAKAEKAQKAQNPLPRPITSHSFLEELKDLTRTITPSLTVSREARELPQTKPKPQSRQSRHLFSFQQTNSSPSESKHVSSIFPPRASPTFIHPAVEELMQSNPKRESTELDGSQRRNSHGFDKLLGTNRMHSRAAVRNKSRVRTNGLDSNPQLAEWVDYDLSIENFSSLTNRLLAKLGQAEVITAQPKRLPDWLLECSNINSQMINSGLIGCEAEVPHPLLVAVCLDCLDQLACCTENSFMQLWGRVRIHLIKSIYNVTFAHMETEDNQSTIPEMTSSQSNSSTLVHWYFSQSPFFVELCRVLEENEDLKQELRRLNTDPLSIAMDLSSDHWRVWLAQLMALESPFTEDVVEKVWMTLAFFFFFFKHSFY